MRIIPILVFALCSCFSCNQVHEKQTSMNEVEPKVVIEPKENVAKPVLGIDVSHFQGDINWEEIKKAGISFAYSKATQGTKFVDPKFAENYDNSQKAGVLHGAYHFYIAGEDPLEQAKNFLNTTKKYHGKSLLPVLDLEQGGVQKNTKPDKYMENVLTWLTTVEKIWGVKPMIYTNHPFGNKYLADKVFGNYDLWIAEYGTPQPKIPEAWKDKGWRIWQRTDRGAVEGAIGNVDHDLLKGSINNLHGLTVN